MSVQQGLPCFALHLQSSGSLSFCRLHGTQEPWDAVAPVPEACIEVDSRLTCIATESGNVLLGSEDGEVEAWSLDAHERLWQVNFSL